MLQRTDHAGPALRPASLLEAFRERTRDLHTRAERAGIIADVLHGRASRAGYALFLRNLLPVYQTIEREMARHAGSLLLGQLVRPELSRAAAIAADLHELGLNSSAAMLSPATLNYVDAITAAGQGDGSRLIAHAYVRYLGDLSGGQILGRLLMRTLDLPQAALSFYEFPAIPDIAAFKADYRAAIDRAGDESDDFDAIVEEGALAFELNIALSVAVQSEVVKISEG